MVQVRSTEKTKISAGVGKIAAEGCVWNNMKLSGGVGLVQFEGTLLGDITVSGGVGKVELTLSGDKDDYYIRAKSSLFDTVRIDGTTGKSYSNECTEASAKNKLHLNGGLGSLEVRFKPASDTETK